MGDGVYAQDSRCYLAEGDADRSVVPGHDSYVACIVSQPKEISEIGWVILSNREPSQDSRIKASWERVRANEDLTHE